MRASPRQTGVKHSRFILGGLAIVLIAGTCGSDGPSDTASTTNSTGPTTMGSTTGPSRPTDADELVGTEWIVDGFVTGGVDFPLVAGASPTLDFAADRPDLGGTTGCNTYFATVDYGAAGEILIPIVGQTAMACAPDAVMVQEQRFTQALSTIRFYEIENGRLTLTSEDGAVVILAVRRDLVILPVELGDVEWIADTRLERDAASSLVPGTEIRLNFDSALGTLGGDSGCNSFGATYVVDDDRMRIDDIAGTEMGCEPAVMEQEQFLYDVLAAADTFEIDGDRLTILATDGRGIGLLAADAE